MFKKQQYFYLLLLIIMIGSSSCGINTEKIPSDILPQKKMIVILTDVQIAEAALQIRNTTLADSIINFELSQYKFIFKKNNVSAAVFKKSFYYYTDRPEIMMEMYKEVISALSKKQAEAVKAK